MMSIKHYTDPELLEINTLENAIYMAMQNDVSFMIGLRLSLYEHQSTFNPNLPLRYLFYISDLYSGMIDKNKLYGSRKILIPPEFVIFYNGIQDQPDRRILRLSDLYSIRDQHCKLELEAVMLNINLGHNPALMNACTMLHQYAEYTDRVRRYTKTMSLENLLTTNVYPREVEYQKADRFTFICTNDTIEKTMRYGCSAGHLPSVWARSYGRISAIELSSDLKWILSEQIMYDEKNELNFPITGDL